VDAMKKRALEQVAAAGKRGLMFEPGWESVTLTELVDDGLVWQEIVRGKYKFTLSPSGESACT
jgi:hypothetical protein